VRLARFERATHGLEGR